MKYSLAILLLFLAAFSRLIPHPVNFTAIGAIALFGVAHFNRHWVMLALPFLSLFLSDLYINNVIYSDVYQGQFVWITSWWLYVAFALSMAVGKLWFRQGVGAGTVTGASLTASTLFFLVSNFSTWLDSGMYPQTGAGLIGCYVAGIPYFGNTVMGDLFFSALMFGGYALITRKASLRQA